MRLRRNVILTKRPPSRRTPAPLLQPAAASPACPSGSTCPRRPPGYDSCQPYLVDDGVEGVLGERGAQVEHVRDDVRNGQARVRSRSCARRPR